MDSKLGVDHWIKQFPDKIYLDRECTIPLPIEFQPADNIHFHGIVVALGAKDGCQSYFKGGTGSLSLTSDVFGNEHLDNPFMIGDVNPNKEFIHVLDDVSLDVVMSELDTITDLTDYLSRKEKLIRGGHLVTADGEQDLLACYLVGFSEEAYERNFINADGKPLQNGERIQIKSGSYYDLYNHPDFLLKKEADRISYLWDNLIQQFTNPMLKGEMATVEEYPYHFHESEFVLRHMAFLNRFERRVHSITLNGLIDNYKKDMVSLCRAALPQPNDKNSKTGFVFLLVAYQDEFDRTGGYEEYRKYRRTMLTAYCMHHASSNLHLDQIIGIASEPPAKITGRRGSSEELLMISTDGWTPERTRYAKEAAEIFNIGKSENASKSKFQESEFPSVKTDESIMIINLDEPTFIFQKEDNDASIRLNRQQRRAEKARKKRRKNT